MINEEIWCHTKETVTMLYLAICQIETSIQESNESMDNLTDTFTELARQTSNPNETRYAMPENFNEKINQAITSFQFYDRISQRLDHVAKGLERMTQIFNDSERLNHPDSWLQIQEEVKSSYSMEAERIMFDEIMNGATIEEALEHYRAALQARETKDDDDIELF